MHNAVRKHSVLALSCTYSSLSDRHHQACHIDSCGFSLQTRVLVPELSVQHVTVKISAAVISKVAGDKASSGTRV